MSTPPPEFSSVNVIPLPGLAPPDKQKSKDRWTAPVMERGYSIVPTILMWGQARLSLTPAEFNVLLQLISHWWFADQDPYPSKKTIGGRMGKDERMVQRYLTSLVRKGFIQRVDRFRPGKGQDSNGYDLSGLVEKLNAIAPEFRKVSEQNKVRRARVERPAQ